MFETFANSFRIKTTHRVNGFIYFLKTIPLLKKALPDSLYKSQVLKTIIMILVMLFELSTIYIFKLIYLAILYVFANIYNFTDTNSSFLIETTLTLLFFTTLIGAWLNNKILEPSKDKYYCVILMRMDAKKVALSDYLYEMFKVFVGFLPITVVASFLMDFSILIALVIPVFIVMAKFTGMALTIMLKTKKMRTKKINSPLQFLEISPILAIALFFTIMGIHIPLSMWYIATGFFIVTGILSIKFLWSKPNYLAIYKRLFKEDEAVLHGTKAAQADANRKMYAKQIDTKNMTIVSNRVGFGKFHDIFVQRHKKLLMNPVKIAAIVELCLLAVVIGFIYFAPSDLEIPYLINQNIFSVLPVLPFILYYANRGMYITQAMFMNCDYSMLTYKFYKEPKSILQLFSIRLKSLILMDLRHCIVIALGLPLLLFLSGGTDNPIDYIMLFIPVIGLSTFFSVHNLVIYYLIQPYNKNLQMKNPLYLVIQMSTYGVCYFMFMSDSVKQVEYFGLYVLAFCVVYIAVALPLVYRLAPKTFRLK